LTLLRAGDAPLEVQGEGIVWHTFAGAAVNRLLAAALGEVTRRKWLSGNLSLRCSSLAYQDIRKAVLGLPFQDLEALAYRAARSMTRGTVSKFQPCLPSAAEERLLVERLLNIPETRDFMARITVNGEKLTISQK